MMERRNWISWSGPWVQDLREEIVGGVGVVGGGVE